MASLQSTDGLAISMVSEHAPAAVEEKLETIQRTSLSSFLELAIGPVRVNRIDRSVRIHCALGTALGTRLASVGAPAFESVDGPTIESLARLLHDLKNRLIAFDIALGVEQPNRTTRLRALLEASQHLDAARAICASARALGSASAPAQLGAFDIGLFFRDYVAHLYVTLPENVELATPDA